MHSSHFSASRLARSTVLISLLLSLIAWAQPVPESAAQLAAGSLIVDVLNCAPADPPIEVLLDTCIPPSPAMPITVSTSDGGRTSDERNDGAGRQIWFGLPIETAQIIITPFASAALVVAYCGADTAPANSYPQVNFTPALPDFVGSVLLPADSGMRCILYVFNQAQTEPTAVVTATPQLEATFVDSAEPTATYDNGLNGQVLDQIAMTVYACPPTLPTDSSLDLILMECVWPAQGVPYVLDTSNQSSPGRTDATGRLEFQLSESGEGDFELDFEYNESNYRTLYLECAEYPTGANPVDYVPWNGASSQALGELDFAGVAGTSYSCIAYLQPSVSRIEIVTWECTEAFSPDGALGTYRSNPDICRMQPDWRYEIRNATSNPQEDRQVPSVSNVFEWPAGESTLTLLLPNEDVSYAPYVHCQTEPWYLGPVSQYGQKPAVGKTVEYDLAVGEMLSCEWFVYNAGYSGTLPATGIETPEYVETEVNGAAAPDSTGYGEIRVYKYTCPGASGGSYSDLASACPNPGADVGFELIQSGNPAASTTTDGTGFAYWPDVADGIVSLQEMPDFNGRLWSPRVFCGSYLSGSGSGLGSMDEYQVVNYERIDLGIEPDWVTVCEWFNIPRTDEAFPTPPDGAGYGSILIHKYICDAPFSADMSYETLNGLCQNNIGGAGFTFTYGTVPEPYTTGNDGLASFSNVPSGDVTIEELIFGSPYRTSAVFCDAYPEGESGTNLQTMAVGGSDDRPSITTNIPSGYLLECYWFNSTYTGLENAYVQMVFLKYVCDSGFDPYTVSSEEPYENCRHEYGQEVTVYGEDNFESTAYTGFEGFAYVNEVPVGLIRTSESASSNYELSRVTCEIYVAGQLSESFEPTVDDGGSYSFEGRANEEIFCRMFNVWTGPPDDFEMGYGSLKIHKYTCVDGMWSESTTVEELDSSCYQEPTSARFIVNPAVGNPIEIQLGDSPYLQTGPIRSGLLEVRELDSDGYRTIRVRCSSDPASENTGELRDVVHERGDAYTLIQAQLRAGYVMFCRWYNAPYYEESPTYTATLNDGFVPGEEYTPTYVDETPYDFTPTSSVEALYTPTYVETTDYTPTYPADYTPTYSATVEYTATANIVAPPPGPTSTPTIPVSGGDLPTATQTAAIEIRKWTCPAGYDPTIEDSDPVADCDNEPGDVVFSLSDGEGEVNEQPLETDGSEASVRFDDLQGGFYTVRELPDEPIDSAFIGSCESNLRTFGEYAFLPYVRVTSNGEVTLRLLDGEELVCFWYNIPRSESTIRLSVFQCPGESPNPARCTRAEQAVDVDLFPVNGGEQVSGLSDDEGALAVEAVPGSYKIDLDGVPACLIDSLAVDDDGQLAVEAGEDVDAAVYQCNGG